MDKTLILASFIYPDRVTWFLNHLETKFSVSRNAVFCYKNLEDDTKLIITFKLTISDNRRLDFKKLFPNAILIHKKGSALYTINALNKLIENEAGGDIGNIDYKSYKINWDVYQDKFILLKNDTLSILPIDRVF